VEKFKIQMTLMEAALNDCYGATKAVRGGPLCSPCCEGSRAYRRLLVGGCLQLGLTRMEAVQHFERW
jgi:hypothetical protein